MKRMQLLTDTITGMAGLLLISAVSLQAAFVTLTISGPQETARSGPTSISFPIDLSKILEAKAQADQLQLKSLAASSPCPPIPAQFEPENPDSLRGTLRWLLPPGGTGPQKWVLERRYDPFETVLRAQKDPANGQWAISESGQPVLRYNYLTIEPGEVLAKVRPADRKYARARSDYIHPLYGLGGEELTKDWSVDHPHHRGIYWAWPEVDYRGERGDLHALQRVFARPTGRCAAQAGPVFAQLAAENLWHWEDQEDIVREQTIVRVWRADKTGRFIDLEFQFTALKDNVAIARRETKLYGGLNLRLASVKDQQIVFHTDAAGAVPRRAWAELSGLVTGGKMSSGLAIFQKPTNPDYPGDWVQYPEINWFQPTFPAAGSRFVLRKEQPLVLKYRLWLHAGKAGEDNLADLWTAYAHPPTVILNP